MARKPGLTLADLLLAGLTFTPTAILAVVGTRTYLAQVERPSAAPIVRLAEPVYRRSIPVPAPELSEPIEAVPVPAPKGDHTTWQAARPVEADDQAGELMRKRVAELERRLKELESGR